MCVSTCQVEFVLGELSCFILLPRSRYIGCSEDFSVLKRTVLLFNYYPGGRYWKSAGTTTLAYRIVINCTTTVSVLELVSTLRLPCSSHRQETEEIREKWFNIYWSVSVLSHLPRVFYPMRLWQECFPRCSCPSHPTKPWTSPCKTPAKSLKKKTHRVFIPLK